MAKLVKSFIGQIGGIASRVTGGDFFGETDSTSESSNAKVGTDGADSSTRAKSPLDFSSKSLSSEEDRDSHLGPGDEGSPEVECPVKRGYLSKWTNYLHGWQERYVVVAEGIMSYYKSEYDTQYGCRGSISLHQVKVLVGTLRVYIHHKQPYCSLYVRSGWGGRVEAVTCLRGSVCMQCGRVVVRDCFRC